MRSRTKVVTLVVLSIVVLMACGEEPVVEAPLRPVKYAVATMGGGDDTRAFAGSVQARDATPLSFRVGGTLDALDVVMGKSVKRGELLARLDQGDFKVAVAEARAGRRNALTARDTAQSEFARVENLFEAGSASRAEYESARGTLESANAQLNAASQRVQQARNQLDYTELRAPFDGVVNAVPVKAGEQVTSGRTVAIVSRGGELEVTAGVPEGVVARIAVQSAVTVVVAALSDDPLDGAVREVGFVSDGATYPVRIELESPPSALRPGMAAEVRFNLGARIEGLRVASSAVGHTARGTFVFVLDPSPDGTFVARRTEVSLGRLVGDEFEVTQGLSAGDRVAVAGLSTLLDGMVVRLLGSEGAGTTTAREDAVERDEATQ